jgi:hypothetical protein
MPIPCGGCGRGGPFDQPYDAATMCRLCFLYANDEGYRARWDASPGTRTVLLPPPPTPIEKGPGWFQKLVSFSKAMVSHAWHGLPATPTEEQKQRLAICLGCEFLNKDNGSCRRCGCAIAIKAAMALQRCPAGKW